MVARFFFQYENPEFNIIDHLGVIRIWGVPYGRIHTGRRGPVGTPHVLICRRVVYFGGI